MSRFASRLAVPALALAVVAAFGVAGVAEAGIFGGKKKEEKKAEKLAKKRAAIDEMAAETLSRLLAESEGARALYDKSAGHAVFDNTKVSLFLTGGGGVGVVVDGDTGNRTYMRMGTGGVNVGLGAQKYQVVFLFENDEHRRRFIENGWDADASANAVAGRAGANAAASFKDGLAVYQLTEAGLMLQADLSGTKYWKADELNAGR